MTVILILFGLAGASLMAEFALPSLFLAHIRRGIRRRHGLQEGRVEAGGVSWSLLRGGQGRSIVFIPGFGSHKYQWGDAIYCLTENADRIFIDMPGAGNTRAPDSLDLSPDAQVEHVMKLLRALGIARVTLVGASVGGLIAGLLASRYPEQVEQLILLDPAGIRGRYISPLLGHFIDTGEQPFCYRTVEDFETLYAVLFKNPPKVPGFLKKHLIKINKKMIPLRLRGLEALRGFVLDGLREHIALLPQQTLVIWGQHDLLFDASATRTIEKLAPWARIVLLDTGHLPYLEQAAIVAEGIEAFLGAPPTAQTEMDVALVRQHS